MKDKIKRLIYLHPLLFALFPILAFYTYNIEKIRFNRFITPIELSIGITILLWLILNFFIKDKHKTSLILSWFLLLFFSYGHIYNILLKFYLNHSEDEKTIVLSLIWLILLGAGSFLILKLGKILWGLSVLFSLTGVLLILTPSVQILDHNLKNSRLSINSNVLEREIQSTNSPDNASNSLTKQPDVYYIILDGYASSEVLKNIYGYDNNAFVNFLEKNNFAIVDNSRSNYSITSLSLASSLNMKYINDLADIVGVDSADNLIASSVIKDSEVAKKFKSMKYHFIHFSSGWGATDRNKFADLTIYCGKINQSVTTLLMTTVLRSFENTLLSQNIRDRILCTFSQLGNIREGINGPIFVFAHIISPHPPYVFGASGEKVKISSASNPVGLDSWQNKEAYLNQLIFINIKVEDLIRQLTADKENLPVIIIQADHGSASTLGMEEYNPVLIQERMRPFIAYHFPKKNNLHYNFKTPINIFRFVFNNYFDSNYTFLEEKNYFSTYERPYKFVDVTEEVNKN